MAAAPFNGYAMTMLMPNGNYLVRYLIPKGTASGGTTGVYAEGVGSTFAKASAEAMAALQALKLTTAPAAKRK